MGSLSPSSATTHDGHRSAANKPVDVALNEIAVRARVFTDAGGAAIALRDGDQIVTRASNGAIAPEVGTRMSVEGSLTGQALLKGIPIHVEDSDTDPRVDAATCRALSTRSFIITPVVGSTTMLGVLAVFASSPNAFTRTDLAVLRTMSDQISAALGGGAFIQQAWPSSPTETAAERAPREERQAQVRDQAADLAPAEIALARVIADVEFESLKEPVVNEHQKSEASVVGIRTTEAPSVEVVALEPETTKVEPAQQAIKVEDVIADPKVPQPALVETKAKAEEVTPIAEHIDVAEPAPAPKPQAVKAATKTQPKAPVRKINTGLSVDEIRARSKSVEQVGHKARREQDASEQETVRTEVVEWKGLSTPEPEGRSMARLIVASVVVLAVGGAIAAAVVLHKPTQASTPANAAVAAPADTGAAPSSATSMNSSGTKTAITQAPAANAAAPSKNDVKQASTQTSAPVATPPPIMLASGGKTQTKASVEEAAPPQLAFAGSQPKLVETSAAMPAMAVPKRPVATEPVPAQLTHKVAPRYPEMAKRFGQKGNVELQAMVLKDGSIGKVDVLSGAMLLRAAAVDAVKQWKYRPAQIAGTPVESQVKIVIAFDTAAQ